MGERIVLDLVVLAVALIAVAGPVAVGRQWDAIMAASVVREAKPTKREVRAVPERPAVRPTPRPWAK